ncbi:MAG: ABC transporter substrate-binding protein [Deltaproteobacteria bacterium]|jgi:iron complex transport system substrate-binding protein|nr:ABC transporter substrate-binding protein [Deltaproteobacteria bacterium]
MKSIVISAFAGLIFLLLLPRCGQNESASATRPEITDEAVNPEVKEDSAEAGFLNLGEFTLIKKEGYMLARDGAGRTLAVIPRGAPHPPGFEPTMVVEIPLRRVAVYSWFDVAIINALGRADTIVAVTTPEDGWHVDYIKRGFQEGRIAFLGDPGAIDYETVKTSNLDLIMTWDPSIVPMMDQLGLPVLVTATPIATCLSTQIRFVEFLAPFFGEEQKAKDFYQKVKLSLEQIRAKTKGLKKPKAMWGDIYEKRVLVEPGNAWVAELIGLAQSDYLFDDVYGTSCIEISVERFLYSGRDADLYFTYRTAGESKMYSKEALLRINPLLEGVKPLTPAGKAFAPLPHYSQSADHLDELLTEIAAILHPDAYQGYRLKYFLELPDKDQQSPNTQS